MPINKPTKIWGDSKANKLKTSDLNSYRLYLFTLSRNRGSKEGPGTVSGKIMDWKWTLGDLGKKSPCRKEQFIPKTEWGRTVKIHGSNHRITGKCQEKDRAWGNGRTAVHPPSRGAHQSPQKPQIQWLALVRQWFLWPWVSGEEESHFVTLYNSAGSVQCSLREKLLFKPHLPWNVKTRHKHRPGNQTLTCFKLQGERRPWETALERRVSLSESKCRCPVAPLQQREALSALSDLVIPGRVSLLRTHLWLLLESMRTRPQLHLPSTEVSTFPLVLTSGLPVTPCRPKALERHPQLKH